ncbi:neuromedin-U [Crocuta crocuta]
MLCTVGKSKSKTKQVGNRLYANAKKLSCSSCVCVRVSQSSVVHPLLQLVPHLHERRTKRFRLDEEFQGPIATQVRRQFLFRPRNGRRSEGYI